MSEENLEIVRETFRLFNADDLDGLRAHLDPRIAMWGPEGWPEPGPEHGHDGVVRQFERLGADYDQRGSELLELIDAGEWVVGHFRWNTRGRASGIATTAEMWFVYRFREGKIVEIRYFWEREDALAAAGAPR